ncbi:Slp family lipoprotein [Thiolapillus sp.]
MYRSLFCLLVSALLAGCNSMGGTRIPEVTPGSLSDTADQSVKGRDFTWGGSVLSLKNLPDHTLVEVMAYPLDSQGQPDAGATPLGRFLADYPGFLEPVEFPSGQLVTVTGPLLGYRDGKVGEADYRYPVLQADQVKRWHEDSRQLQTRPNVHFGFGFGSGGYSNIGIGIGF